jgi:hypothetical protein
MTAVVHTWSPSYLGGWAGRTTWILEFKASLGNIARLHFKKENKYKISRSLPFCRWHDSVSCLSRAWWHTHDRSLCQVLSYWSSQLWISLGFPSWLLHGLSIKVRGPWVSMERYQLAITGMLHNDPLLRLRLHGFLGPTKGTNALILFRITSQYKPC